MFDSIDTRHNATMLVNSRDEKANDANWAFDPVTLSVSNNSHWKGIFPRDQEIPSTLTLYLGGFWKRFSDEASGVTGVTHPFEVPVFARNKASNVQLEGFGKAILLEYTEPVFNRFFDVLKLVDEDTILGKAFFGQPKPGREILTFSVSRKYPFEFMTEEDHGMVYARMRKPPLASMVGIWDGQLVSDSAWTPPVFRFRYYFDSGGNLKNDYLFAGTLAGTAVVEEKADHLEMHGITGVFHDEIRQVNKDILIGKYYSDPNFLFRWLPEGLTFIHVDRSRPSISLPYVLKRVGDESAFRGYAD